MRCLLVVDPIGRVVVADVDSGARFVFDDVPTVGSPAGVPGPGPATSGPSTTPTAAAAVAGGTRLQARTAVWSAPGQWTAWSVDGGDLGDLDTVQELRVHHEGSDTNEVLSSALTAFYLSPSPDGRHLAHLSPGPLGLELAVSDVHTGALQVVERGQPLFWSWSPDSTRLAIHVGSRVVLADLDGGEQTVLTEEAGSFVAPWWMPDGSVVVVEQGGLVAHGPDGTATALPCDAVTGRFSLDPDGRRIALVDVVDGRPALVVVDLLTGESTTVTTRRIAAFFWSPDGRRLAVLVAAGRGALQWLVFDGADTLALQPFRPGTAWLREVLPFFEQYAQSHHVWSADSAALVAPAIDEDGSTEAIVQRASEPTTTERLPGARLAWWAD